MYIYLSIYIYISLYIYIYVCCIILYITLWYPYMYIDMIYLRRRCAVPWNTSSIKKGVSLKLEQLDEACLQRALAENSPSRSDKGILLKQTSCKHTNGKNNHQDQEATRLAQHQDYTKFAEGQCCLFSKMILISVRMYWPQWALDSLLSSPFYAPWFSSSAPANKFLQHCSVVQPWALQ